MASLLIFLMAACGGGGSNGSTNHPPVAATGSIQTVYKRSIVTLDGSPSSDPDQDSLTYAWTQTGGPSVVLNGATSAKPSFVAPSVSGTLAFSLVVNDGKVASSPALSSVLVQNRPPVAVTSGDATVKANSACVLDGSLSTDPDGDPVTCSWVQTSGTAVSLQPLGASKATFVAPGTVGVLTFRALANDGETNSQPVTVTITIEISSNGMPIANAGPNQTVGRRAQVTLAGSGSDPDLDPLSYHWEQTGGTVVSLQNPNVANPTFSAPAIDGDLQFVLFVNDGQANSLPSAATVHVVDRAPTITSVALAPSAPKRGDAISAVVKATDPDADPLSYAYTWKRNGVVVPSATEATYPLGNQAKNDVISLTVTASDGTLSATSTAQVTIVDTPATLSVSAPTTASVGQTVSFPVSAVDVDGDAIGDLEMEFGPAGFTITKAGLVTWSPSGPMFDQSMDFNWAVRLKADPTARLTGTITLNDPNRKYPLMRTNPGVPLGSHCLDIQDFDGNGSKVALIGSNVSLYILGKVGTEYVQTWAYPFDPGQGSVISAVASGDVDGDGRREIFFASGNLIVQLDGVNRREAARFGGVLSDLGGPTALVTWKALKFADVDKDGVAELICLGSEGSYGGTDWLYVLDARTLALKWKTSQPSMGSSLAVANVDSDPALEIITSGGYVFDGSTHANEWYYGAGFGSVVDAGDVDGDGVAEIIGLVGWSPVRVYSATLKSPLWEISGFDFDSIKLVDLDGDGKAEILVGDGQWGNVTVYRYDSQTKAGAVVAQINSQDHGVSGLAAGDLDGDGKAELIWGTGLSSSGADVLVVAGWNPTLAVEWKGPSPQLDGPFTGAKLATTAPGQTRLIYATPQTASGYQGMRVLAMDPDTGAMSQSTEVDSNWSRVSACDVGDVLGTGLDQVLLGTAAWYDNYFTAIDFATSMKMWSSMKLGSAAAIAHADLNADGVSDLVGITTDGYVYAWDVAHQISIWTSTGLGSGRDAAVADLDGDGKPEIIALAGNRLVVFSKSVAAGTYLESASYAITGSDLLVADTDGDGKPEIYVLGYSTSGGALRVYRFDANLQVAASFPAAGAQSLHLEESDFARKNLLVSFGGNSYPPSSAKLLAVDPMSGATIWSSPDLKGGIPINSLGFCGATGQRRISFGTTKGMYVTR